MPITILEGPDGKPVTAKGTEDGLQRVAVDSISFDAAGLATETAQLAQTVAVEAALGPKATTVDVQAVESAVASAEAAIVALGEGASQADVVAALTALLGGASETTLAAVLSLLQVRLPAALEGGRLAVESIVSGTVSITGTVAISNFPATQAVSIAAPVAVTGTFFQATQPVSVASLPLAPDASTATLQGTANASLSTVATNTSTTATQTTAINANTDGLEGLATAGNVSAAASAASLASIDGGTPAALGQATMAASMPVTIASNQTAIGVTAASLPLPSGAATSVLQGGGLPVALVGGRLDTVIGAALPAGTNTIGAVTGPGAVALATAANQATEIAALGTIDAGIPSTLGQLAPSLSMSVVRASGVRAANSDTILAASTSRTLIATPARLVHLEWRYIGAGTKYLVLLDQATTPGTAANWIGWYESMTNGSGREWFEFLTPISFATGITVAVTATEPVAGTPIVLSTTATENFSITFFQTQ